MAIKLIGYEHKQGVFDKDGKNIEYNNRLLHCVDDTSVSRASGCLTTVVKLKMDYVANSLGVAHKDDTVNTALEKVINKEIVFTGSYRGSSFNVNGFRVIY